MKEDRGGSLSVWLVTMYFPVPSETFFGVEAEALRDRGITVTIKTLGSRPSNHDAVNEQQRVQCPVDHGSIGKSLAGFALGIRRPRLVLRLLVQLATRLWSRPILLGACIFFLPRALHLLREVEESRPDVVHLYWGHFPSLLGWLVLETLPLQVLTIGLSAYDLEMGLPISFSVAKRCHGVRTWSDCNVSTLTKHGVPPSRVGLVYQGVDTTKFSPAEKAQRRIITACRLIPEKGVDFLIRVIEELRHRGSDVMLDVFGDGPELERLRTLIARSNLGDLVSLHGHVDHGTLGEAMSHASFFALHSTHSAERLPNVLKEALACGCYCFTTPTPDVSRLVDDGGGEIIPAQDRIAWVEAISRKLEDVHEEVQPPRSRLPHRFDLSCTTNCFIEFWRKYLPAGCDPGHKE